MTHLRWSQAGGGSQWSKLVSTLYQLKEEETTLFSGCALLVLMFSLQLFHLPSLQGLEWPDICRPLPISGDYSPFPCSHPTHVIHSSDDGNFGKTHQGLLKVFCLLQCLQPLHSISYKVSFPHQVTFSLQFSTVTYSLLSPTSSLETSARGKQIPHSSTSSTSVQCLVIRHINTKTVKSDFQNISGKTWMLGESVFLPRWSPDTVNLFGLCPVHSPT